MLKVQKVPLNDNLTLTIQGDGNGDKFVKMWNHAWSRLPPIWKRRLKKHWRKKKIVPQIRLKNRTIDSYIAKQHRPKKPNTLAWVEFQGRAFNFTLQYFNKLPIKLGAAVVAHEIGHVVMTLANGFVDDCSRIEEEQIDWMARAWGHDMYAVEEWLDDNVKKYDSTGLPIYKR